MAIMPAFIASGSSGHAATTAAKSESATSGRVVAILVAVGVRGCALRLGPARQACDTRTSPIHRPAITPGPNAASR
jgi:hypothetical protein